MIHFPNKEFTTTPPYYPKRIKDRNFAVDDIRDHYALIDLAARALSWLSSSFPVILSGGIVTQGAGDTLNITPCRAIVGLDVLVPDTAVAWTIPAAVMTEEIYHPVESTQQTNLAIPSATLNGVAVNYVKLRYAETDGPTRQKVGSAEVYPYEMIRSFEIIVDTVAPTTKEVQLDSFTGTSGVPFVFSGAKKNTLSFNDLTILNTAKEQLTLGRSVPEWYIRAQAGDQLKIWNNGQLRMSIGDYFNTYDFGVTGYLEPVRLKLGSHFWITSTYPAPTLDPLIEMYGAEQLIQMSKELDAVIFERVRAETLNMSGASVFDIGINTQALRNIAGDLINGQAIDRGLPPSYIETWIDVKSKRVRGEFEDGERDLVFTHGITNLVSTGRLLGSIAYAIDASGVANVSSRGGQSGWIERYSISDTEVIARRGQDNGDIAFVCTIFYTG